MSNESKKLNFQLEVGRGKVKFIKNKNFYELKSDNSFFVDKKDESILSNIFIGLDNSCKNKIKKINFFKSVKIIANKKTLENKELITNKINEVINGMNKKEIILIYVEDNNLEDDIVNTIIGMFQSQKNLQYYAYGK